MNKLLWFLHLDVGKLTACLAVIGLAAMCQPAAATQFIQRNLVTGPPDPYLINAWGMSYSPTGPFWVSDNGTGKSTLYSVSPQDDTVAPLGLVVTIPGDGSVTGQVFNNGAQFNADRFLFVSEDGTIVLPPT